MDVTRKLIVIGLLLLATLVSGFGKTWNVHLSGFHKLFGLAWVVFTGILVYQAGRQIESRAAFFAAVAVLGVSVVALFWSGSVLTMPKLANGAWLNLHRVATAVAVIATGVLARLFLLGKP